MARQKLGPPPMTYQEWKAAGCPPLLLPVTHVALWIGITAMQVNNYCKNGKLFRYSDGPHKSKIPTDHERNLEWLLDRSDYEPREAVSSGCKRTGSKPNPRTAAAPSGGSAGGTQRTEWSPSVAGAGEDMLNVEEVLDALRNMDLSKLSSNAVAKIARVESALKTRADREAKRGLLIDRSLVSTVFNRMYQIDANELKTIAAKVAPDVAAELGAEDPAIVLRIEKRIDDEVIRVLTHIKRLLDDFLVGVGTDPVAD